MFAKVFEQIFDSSIAQDYTVRHMFIDLLILADPTGAVDMTYDAISRRTNVPEETIRRCIVNLCQPDVNSRSPLEDGKRLIPLDSHRDWGWKIVNYHHYRKIRDQEVRRSYFRDYQRKRRKKLKIVKDRKVNTVNNIELSSSTSSLSKSVQDKFNEWMQLRRSMGKPPKNWDRMFSEQVKWLKRFSVSQQLEILSQSIRNNYQGLFEPKNIKQSSFKDESKPLNKSSVEVPERFKSWVAERYPAKREEAMKWRTWADVPPYGLRQEWWKEEKDKLPIGDVI